MATAPSPPILIWQPGGGVPGGPVSNPPVYSQSDVTPCVQGQQYVDVVFGSVQTTTDWVLVSCEVYNTTDLDPLNIWPGIITNRTAAGFRVWFNGLPDSGNYYLSWAVSGVNILPVPATQYLFTGSTSGIFGVDHPFTVRLPPSTTVPVPITITPNDGGLGGTFSPPTVTLSSGSASATFIYNAVAYGAATISVTNSGTLVDPASIVYTSIAPTYTFSGPTGGVSGVASTNFTVQLAGDAEVVVPTTITPHDGGAGGTFTPTTVLLVAGVGVHFTYTPSSAGAKTISVTNDGGLANPANLTYTATVPSLADGDPVSTWWDSSVNGNNATMTGSNRPTFKTAIVNGKPIVRFTTAGSSGLNLASAISGAPPWCVFVVMKQSTGITGMGGITGNGATGYPFILIAGDGNCYIGNRDGYEFGVNPSVAFHVFTADSRGGGNFHPYYDGTFQTFTASAAANSGDFVSIGWTSVGTPSYSDGDIAEIIIYTALVATPDRQNIEKYLGTKYGITVAAGTVIDPTTVTGLAGWWKADTLG